MVTLDTAVLRNASCEKPVLGLAVAHAVDHPGTWLEMLDALPCPMGETTACLQMHVPDDESGVTFTVNCVNSAEPVADAADLQGSKDFEVALMHDNESFGKLALAFSVEASEDQVTVCLELRSHDEWVIELTELASCAALAMAGLLHTASREVVRAYHRALSPDLAETTVSLRLVAPNVEYAPLLDAALAELTARLAEETDTAFRPTCVGAFANTPGLVVANPVSGSRRLTLSAEQRLALAVNLSALREARNMSQLEVAHKALGFSKSHAAVSRLERGILSEVEAERVELLAKFYDTDVDSLLNNRQVSSEPTAPGETKELHLFHRDREFKPSVKFGSRITLARTAAGLSVHALAKKLGHVTSGTVQTWESEGATPRRDSFIDLGMALETPVSWLMFGHRVGTPDRALALRLTSMQKLYGLTNGEVAALMKPTCADPEELLSTGHQIHRLSVARHGIPTKDLRALAKALQVPAEWLSPPDVGALRDEAQSTEIALANIASASDMVRAAALLSKPAKKLLNDIVELIELGVLTDENITKIRKDLATNYMAPYIRGAGRKQLDAA